MVEEDGANIVQMTVEREQAASSLVGPDFDFIIVPPRYKEGLRLVEVNATDRAIMLFKSVDQSAHAIVP